MDETEARMTSAIMIESYGGPETLQMHEVPVPATGSGDLRIRHTAIGVNYHDIYVRSGLYRRLHLPLIPGLEAAGIVEEVGQTAAGFAPGDRVAYLDTNYGAYAVQRVVPASLALKLPDAISNDLAATVLLKGLTAAILVLQVHPIQQGDIVLVHAAAGGVGRMLVQWTSHLGAHVIGTVGSPEKAVSAVAAGCRDVIQYNETDFMARVMDLTKGRGVDVVYDAVGRDTFDGSLGSLAMRGHLVNYGQSSGPVEPFDISRLTAKSATITRPAYGHYVETRPALENMAETLWRAIGEGILKVEPGTAFSLAEAAQAHDALERRVAGPLILKP